MAQASGGLAVTAQEYVERRERLADLVGRDALIVLLRPLSINYLLGFGFASTERPLGIVIDGTELTAVVPRLEREFIEEASASPVGTVVSYDDYPGGRPPMELLRDMLTDRGAATGRPVVSDSPGYPGASGYRGPSLAELLPGTQISICQDEIEALRRRKSAAEVAILRRSAEYSDLAHARLQELCLPGANENDVALAAEHLAIKEILAGPDGAGYVAGHPWLTALVTLRGQIGPNGAYPHATNKNLVMRAGDVVVTAAMVYVQGYVVELERTMVIGSPSAEQRRFFQHMLGAQETGRDALRPGRRCSDVDRAVRDYYERHDLTTYWRHHTGHGLGLEVHESPFLDVGDDTVIEEGMVFSIEPGIYVPGLGGFRHSDTALVTADGAEFLGTYPRDLDAMTCPVNGQAPATAGVPG
jgi:Xaa-Pro aminopeptidase